MRLRNPFNLFRRKKVITIVPAEDDTLPRMLPKPVPVSQGHIVKVKRAPDYKPNAKRPAGGRVVRTMPRNLRKLKEYAENEDS